MLVPRRVMHDSVYGDPHAAEGRSSFGVGARMLSAFYRCPRA